MMKEILKISDTPKAIDCNITCKLFNTRENKEAIIGLYNKMREVEKLLQEERQKVRILENQLDDFKDTFKMVSPMVELVFLSKNKTITKETTNFIINNPTDYRNKKI